VLKFINPAYGFNAPQNSTTQAQMILRVHHPPLYRIVQGKKHFIKQRDVTKSTT